MKRQSVLFNLVLSNRKLLHKKVLVTWRNMKFFDFSLMSLHLVVVRIFTVHAKESAHPSICLKIGTKLYFDIGLACEVFFYKIRSRSVDVALQNYFFIFVVFSACGGRRTGKIILVLTACFPVLV